MVLEEIKKQASQKTKTKESQKVQAALEEA